MSALFIAKFEGANTAFGAYAISFALCLTFLEVSKRQNHEDLFFPPPRSHRSTSKDFLLIVWPVRETFVLKQKLEVFDYNYM